MNKKTLFLFVLLLIFAGYVVSLLISRARFVDTLYGGAKVYGDPMEAFGIDE